MRLSDPVVSFILVVLIGIVAGWAIERFMRTTWLTKQIAGPRRVLLTSALVGVAGAFIGFHLATLASLPRGSLVPLIAAAIGALVILWAWRTVKV